MLELLNLLITKGQKEELVDSHFRAYYYPNIETHRFLAKILCPLNNWRVWKELRSLKHSNLEGLK